MVKQQKGVDRNCEHATTVSLVFGFFLIDGQPPVVERGTLRRSNRENLKTRHFGISCVVITK